MAARQRAEAEAAFRKIAPGWTPLGPSEPKGPVKARRDAPDDRHFRKSEFEIRYSERDSLVTDLRFTDQKKKAVSIARDLVARFQLPPDQDVLVKVLSLGEPDLVRPALEELLELDDRGRVRANPALTRVLKRVKISEPDLRELKDLLLAKLGLK